MFCATMNPGGDFGKKELSPALRNRFMEIWCPTYSSSQDVFTMIQFLGKDVIDEANVKVMANLVDWLNAKLHPHHKMSYRDIRSWVEFVLAMSPNSKVPVVCSIVHGLCMVLLDGLQTLGAFGSDSTAINQIKTETSQKIQEWFNHSQCECLESMTNVMSVNVTLTSKTVAFGKFVLPRDFEKSKLSSHIFETPSVTSNAFKVVRGLQIKKPVLLEGPPGAGKSALIQALALATGNELTRINLSEQTDISDLFGTDLPDKALGQFNFYPGPVLTGMKAGHWILLDELNLATQSVLEGLNACLDHRGEVYIPELDQSFTMHPNCKIFATQNPYQDGSGRKGLPKSFLNRFVKVFTSELNSIDFKLICSFRYPTVEPDQLNQMITVIEDLNSFVRTSKPVGGPWTFNLRDLLRWCQTLDEGGHGYVAEQLFVKRFRTENDKRSVRGIIRHHFPMTDMTAGMSSKCTDFQFGSMIYFKLNRSQPTRSDLVLHPKQYPILESVGFCINTKLIPILVGKSGCGKTSVVKIMADLAGQTLHSIYLNQLSDASELIGSFELTTKKDRLMKLLPKLLKINDCLIYDERIVIDRNVIGVHLQNQEKLLKNVTEHETAREVADAMHSFLNLVEDDFGACVTNAREDIESIMDYIRPDCTFTMVNSPLVEAIENGHWLVIENANFCPASVLDRLNGLFEDGGKLMLTTDQDGKYMREIIRHEHFAVVMTMDPQNGELSPAMR